MVKAFDILLSNFYIEHEEEEAENSCDPNICDNNKDICLDDILAFLPQNGMFCTYSATVCERWAYSPKCHKFTTLIKTQENCIFNQLVRKSTVAVPYLRSKGIVLQAQNVTRWNFQLKMVKSILKSPVEVNNAIDLLSQREQRYKKIMASEISALIKGACDCTRTFS